MLTNYFALIMKVEDKMDLFQAAGENCTMTEHTIWTGNFIRVGSEGAIS